ncbi:hypothetical protein ACVWZV_002236 [Bradyrhizobium sp. GM5.1]
MTLMLHAGAKPATYDDLRGIHTPDGTSTHLPVPHHELVELVRFTLGFYQHEIAEEHHAITEDGSRYFGLLSLRSPYGDYCDSLGLRNSHDRSCSLGICHGSRVFVCDNLAFMGDHVIKRKHTAKAKKELPGLITEIIRPLQDQRIAQNLRLLNYQQMPLSDAQADHAIMDLYRKDVIGVQAIGHVLNQWEMPEHNWGATRPPGDCSTQLPMLSQARCQKSQISPGGCMK